MFLITRSWPVCQRALSEIVETGKTMNKLLGTRCLVTGGAGFIGSTIVDQLLAAGASEVRVIDNFVRGNWGNLESAMEHGGVKVIEGDICNRTLVEEIIEGVD